MKKSIALLTTLAILVSLVAMLGGLSVTSGAAYEPKRVISYTAGGTQIEGKILVTASGTELGAGQEVTVKGYVKVENYVAKNTTDHNVQVGQGGGATGGFGVSANCDWTPFEVKYTTGDGNWLKFGFWYAQGTMSIADVTFEDANGNVIYDMATDTKLVAGTYDADKQPAQMGMWYIGYYGEKSEISCTVGAVYSEPYAPKRAMTITASNGDVNSKFTITGSGTQVGADKTVTVKGYYKVENFTKVSGSSNERVIIMGGVANVYEDTNGWVYFEKTGYVTGDASANWLASSFWYANGTLGLADVVFEDENGTVIYDMAKDEALPAGTFTNCTPMTKGMWYMSHYNNKANVEINIDPIYTEPYAPKRVMSLTAFNNDVNAKFTITGSGSMVGADRTVTVKGYFKVDNFTSVDDTKNPNITIAKDAAKVTGDTNGWVYFEKTGYVTGDASTNWLAFSFWYANGTLSLADVVFEENGTVIYDMAKDEQLPAGDFTNCTPMTKGMWYMSHYNNKANVAIHIDPVYVPETYTPSRVISMTTAGAQINGKIYLYNSNLLGAGKKVTAKGYYKVENYTVANANNNPKIISDALGNITADCDWTPFEIEFTTGSGKALDLEFWYTQGTVSFADVTIAEEDGTYIYDMSVDEDLVAGTYDSSNWAINQGIWYFGYYSTIDAATYTVGEKADSGLVVIPPPYDPELVELPEIPNMIEADKNGYTPNRAFAVINGVHKNPKASYALFATPDDYAVAGNKYYVFLKYRVYSLADGVSANIKINGQTVLTTTETTDAWVQLLDENGKLYTFENVEEDDIISFIFDLNGGAGCFAIADFIVANQKGEIIYSLANDKTMHIETDLRYVSNGIWKGDPYVADKNGPTLFPIQTKVEEYKPTAVVSLTQDNKIKGSSAEAFLYFRTNNSLFTAGETYTISGMFMSEIVCGYNGNANPGLKFSDSTGAAQIVDIANHGTNGNWYPLLTPDGKPVTFKGTPEEDWMKINLYCTYGTVALADIVITDSQGNVVYDMAADTELKAAAGEFTGNVADIGGPLLRHALYKNGTGKVWFADAAQTNTETSKQIPTFVETVEIPVEECDHDFVDGTCTKCGEADPDYVPACDHDFVEGVCTKCGEEDPTYVPACDHDFVDGTCTKCGEADPDYVPGGDEPIEPPAQTGDESMIFVIALGTFAVIALAALTLNKKKFNA